MSQPQSLWHVKTADGRHVGPLSKQQLDQLAAAGRLLGCQVRHSGWAEWRRAEAVYPPRPPSLPVPIDQPKTRPIVAEVVRRRQVFKWSPRPLSFNWSPRPLCFAMAAVGLLAWLVSLGQPPGPIVLVNYAALLATCAATALGITDGGRNRWLCAGLTTLFILVTLPLCVYLDMYTAHWVSPAETPEDFTLSYTDTVHRWSGRIRYRRVYAHYPESPDDFNLFHGPLSASGKRHGEWRMFMSDSYLTKTYWYWYGEEVTEGEWHLRNR